MSRQTALHSLDRAIRRNIDSAAKIFDLGISYEAVVDIEGRTRVDNNRNQAATEIIMVERQRPARDNDFAGVANIRHGDVTDLVAGAVVDLQRPSETHGAAGDRGAVVQLQRRARRHIDSGSGVVVIGDGDGIERGAARCRAVHAQASGN